MLSTSGLTCKHRLTESERSPASCCMRQKRATDGDRCRVLDKTGNVVLVTEHDLRSLRPEGLRRKAHDLFHGPISRCV